MASPTSQTPLKSSLYGGSSVSGSSPPADQTTFSFAHGGPSVSGSSPAPAQLTYNPYQEYLGPRVTLVNTSPYPALISSAPTTRGRMHPNQEDVYVERPKAQPEQNPIGADIHAPPPYSPHHHQHPNAFHDTGTTSHGPSMGATAAHLQEPMRSEVQLQCRGEGGGTDVQPAVVARHPSEEFPTTSKERSLYKRPICWFILIGLVVVIIAAIVPICYLVIKKHPAAAQAAVGNSSTNTEPITGGDGSVIYVDGSPSFVYSNSFGGSWYYDSEDPFNNSAQANLWTPPLSTPWDYGKDRINGVNLGGLFILEPITTPDLFQTYAGSVDEWTLSTMMMATNGNLSQIEDHYNTFITEQDIADIAGAGLNWIRLPIPYWAIETWAGEPFLEKVSWQYILRVLQWARKYGLRVNLDLNTIPGSQNGLNHSGKIGSINFLHGVMGIANAQRTLDYIRIITEFISQPEWANVVPMFSVMNEPEQIHSIGNSTMYSFYLKVHDMIRGITGVGEGPFIVISDGWGGVGFGSQWNSSILNGADRIALDTHLYYAFDTPLAYPNPAAPCTGWAANVNRSKIAFGVTIVGEFTAGFNTCGLFVKGVNEPPNATLNCDLWIDHTSWNGSVVSAVLDFTLSSMDAAQDYFFRTWKIGNATDGTVKSPLWSYQLGLQNGWIPKNPQQAISHCANQGAGGSYPFNGQFESWQTGGAGAGIIASTFIAEYGQWPPNIAGGLGSTNAAPLLPMYTSTGAVATLPPPTLTASVTHSISVGDGWYDSSDTIGGVTAAAGCAYPNAWSAVSIAIPTVCGATPATAAAYFTLPPTPR